MLCCLYSIILVCNLIIWTFREAKEECINALKNIISNLLLLFFIFIIYILTRIKSILHSTRQLVTAVITMRLIQKDILF